jgi:hypothetical protein
MTMPAPQLVIRDRCPVARSGSGLTDLTCCAALHRELGTAKARCLRLRPPSDVARRPGIVGLLWRAVLLSGLTVYTTEDLHQIPSCAVL